VYDPYPKYMTELKLDYEEDREKMIKNAEKTLEMRKMTDLEKDMMPENMPTFARTLND